MLLTSNRAAAFLHLVKLNKALADAETTISLKPDWEKVHFLHTYGSYFYVWICTFHDYILFKWFWMYPQGHFRKGCVLEALERYDDVRDLFCLHRYLVSYTGDIEFAIYWVSCTAGFSCFSSCLEVQLAKFGGVQKNQEAYTVSKR